MRWGNWCPCRLSLFRSTASLKCGEVRCDVVVTAWSLLVPSGRAFSSSTQRMATVIAVNRFAYLCPLRRLCLVTFSSSLPELLHQQLDCKNGNKRDAAVVAMVSYYICFFVSIVRFMFLPSFSLFSFCFAHSQGPKCRLGLASETLTTLKPDRTSC